MPPSDDELNALLPPLPDDLFDERGYVRPDRLEEARQASFGSAFRASQTARPSAGQFSASAGDDPTSRYPDVTLAIKLWRDDGLSEAEINRKLERDAHGAIEEMRDEITRRRALLVEMDAEQRQKDKEASPEGQAAINEEALREERELARNAEAGRARLRRDWETLGVPPDSHRVFSDAEVAGFFEPSPDESQNVEANLRAAGEKGGDE